MRQTIQSLRTGQLLVAEVPIPNMSRSGILLRTVASLVSAGTERMVVDFAEKNLLYKARSRPDLVRQTLEKAQREGVLSTFEAVQNRMSQPMALGYSSAGTVVDVGAEVTQFKVGDRVACAGSGHAVHAEVAAVTITLTVALPDNVSYEAASFTTLGAIALHGIRLAEAKLGLGGPVAGRATRTGWDLTRRRPLTR